MNFSTNIETWIQSAQKGDRQHSLSANKHLVSYRGDAGTPPVIIRVYVEVWVKDMNLDSQSLLLFQATER